MPEGFHHLLRGQPVGRASQECFAGVWYSAFIGGTE